MWRYLHINDIVYRYCDKCQHTIPIEDNGWMIYQCRLIDGNEYAVTTRIINKNDIGIRRLYEAPDRCPLGWKLHKTIFLGGIV